MTDIEKVISYIQDAKETETVDYKLEFYKNLPYSDLPKDIAAFANHPSDDDKFIIFGVEDKTKAVYGLKNEPFGDISEIENYLFKTIEPYVKIEAECFDYFGKRVAYIKISSQNKNRPYVIKKTCGNKAYIEKGDIYIRKGTCNQKADRMDIDAMYENNGECRVSIFHDDILISPNENGVYSGNLKLEIQNSMKSPLLMVRAKISLKNKHATILENIVALTPSDNLSKTPVEIPANTRRTYDARFAFTDEDCFRLKFEESGNLLFETTAYVYLEDIDGNKYYSTYIPVSLNAVGPIKDRVADYYRKWRNNIISQEEAILESIKNNSKTLFNELQGLELEFLQPWYVRDNESYPEIDALKRIVIALNAEKSTINEKMLKCFPVEFVEYCLK